MDRVFNSRVGLRRAAWLALIAMPMVMAQASSAQEQAWSTQDQPDFAEQADFEEHFAPFDKEPSLYDPDDAPKAVDLNEIVPPIEQAEALEALGAGGASYYGKRFHGRKTASGERFDMNAMTAAHRTLPFGSKIKVTNPSNGLSVVVRINDRGPFAKGRVIDLSRAAAQSIGMIQRGHARVELDLVQS
jgi:rare lipoprotein A